jgi:hypothetical protein
MNITKLLMVLSIAIMPVALMSGCNAGDQGKPKVQNGHDHDHDHVSHAHGPHGGHLIELGDDAYHLEWDHDDDAQTIVMYVLDGEATNEVAIAAESIKVTFAVQDETRDFEVRTVKEEGQETTSRFESNDADLFALMTSDESAGTVMVEIEGAPYQGKIEHHHHH